VEKELSANDIHKEMFPVYGGKCLSRKAVHSWSRNSRKDVPKSQMIADQARKWPRQQSKRLLCCGIRGTGKTMGQMYQCWMICREINVY
jgi:hypothetical protein